MDWFSLKKIGWYETYGADTSEELVKFWNFKVKGLRLELALTKMGAQVYALPTKRLLY